MVGRWEGIEGEGRGVEGKGREERGGQSIYPYPHPATHSATITDMPVTPTL